MSHVETNLLNALSRERITSHSAKSSFNSSSNGLFLQIPMDCSQEEKNIKLQETSSFVVPRTHSSGELNEHFAVIRGSSSSVSSGPGKVEIVT